MSTTVLAPGVMAKLMKEMRKLNKQPLEGIRVNVDQENLSVITAEIDGPEGTPFEGGIFQCKIVLGEEFPSKPPKGYFVTKIFHPNVSNAGDICVNTLKRDWKPDHGIAHVLLVIRCLLIYPNAESALNEDAGKLILEDYADFEKRARLMTKIHARPKENNSDVNQGTLTSSLEAEGSNIFRKETNSKLVEQKKPKKALDKTKIKKKKAMKRL